MTAAQPVPEAYDVGVIRALIGAQGRVDLLAGIDSPGTGADLLAACRRFVQVCEAIPPHQLAEYIGDPTDWSLT